MRVFKSLIILVGTIIFSLFLVLLLGIIGLRAMVLLWGYGDVYQTEDPAHYGEYIGNFDDKTPAAFINSFFPETIDTSFSNVQYHYKAKKGDAYAYEAVLEFSVQDADLFSSLKKKWIDESKCTEFSFDPSFVEFTISEDLHLTYLEDVSLASESSVYSIEYAKVGKILVSEEEQKFLFVAIGVFDGGGTNTEELSYFFKRFSIDPRNLDFASVS